MGGLVAAASNHGGLTDGDGREAGCEPVALHPGAGVELSHPGGWGGYEAVSDTGARPSDPANGRHNGSESSIASDPKAPS
jgi:hypothetical protein